MVLDTLTIEIIALVITGVICGVFCAVVAYDKGRNSADWFLAGLFFNVFALIAVAGLPVLLLPRKVQCPHCGENLDLDIPERVRGCFVCPDCNKVANHTGTQVDAPEG